MNKSFTRAFGRICCGLLLFGASAWADSISILSSSTSFFSGADDIHWAQLGQGATLGQTFNASSDSGKISAAGAFSAAGTCVAAVGPSSGCAWTPAPPLLPAGETVLWSFDGNNGTGPLSLSFNQGLTEFGLAIQDDSLSGFTAFLTAFGTNGLLGTFTVASNNNGDPVFLGLRDNSGANITSVQLGLVGCGLGCDTRDFAVGTARTTVPEPGSLILLGSGLLGLSGLRRRR